MEPMTPQILIPGAGLPYQDGDTLDHRAPLAFTLSGVLDAAACAALIARIEALGPSAAPITTVAGPVMRAEVRNNERVMFDDVALAAALFDRVAAALPATVCGLRACGVNERFRGYRYTPGQRFAPHYDGAFVRDARERSQLTFMIYLNDGFTGGATTFLDWGVRAIPRTGDALLFQHYLLHEGSEVERGTKYVLRSDVMFRA